MYDPIRVVYLLHFDAPLGNLANPRGQAQHYLGTTCDLHRRLQEHRSGNGSHIMAAVARRGIPWRLVRTWLGGRELELRLKGRKQASAFCPICQRKF